MKKTLLLILCLLLSLLAKASPDFVINYENFMLMNVEQQNQILVKMMETIVELEQKHLGPDKTVNVNYFHLNKTREFFSKLQSLLISRAYAAGVNEKVYLDFAEQFNNALKESGKTDKCIYAGWVSRFVIITKYVNGKKVQKGHCAHPKNLAKNDELYLSYKKLKTSCLSDEIACQPAIFGFSSGEKPICVKSVVNSDIQNASAKCMKLALEPPAGFDSKEDRFSDIKKLMTENSMNKKIFDDMHLNLARACICKKGVDGIHKKYQQYMQPHQTCYGLMRSSKYIHNECYPNEINDREEFAYFKAIDEKLKIPEQDARNTKNLSTPWNEYANKIAEYSEAKFCTDQPQAVVLKCISSCETIDGKTKCTFKDESTGKTLLPNSNTEIEPGKKIMVYDSEKNSTECEVEAAPVINHTYECSSECSVSTEDQNKRNCKFSVIKDSKLEEKLKPKPEVYNDVALEKGKNEVTVSIEDDNKTHELKCLITPEKTDEIKPIETKPEEKILGCSAKCETVADNKISCKDISILEDGLKSDDIKIKTNLYEGEEPKDKIISVEYEKNGISNKINCDIEVKQPEKKIENEIVNYDLVLKIDETKTDSVTVSALINEKSIIPEGHSVEWKRKDTGKLTFDSEKKQKSTPIPDGNAEGVEIEKEDTGIVASGLKTTQPRKTEDYKICATLLDSTKKSIQEKCETIPKKTSLPRQQNGGGRKLPPAPQMPNRGNGMGSGYGGMI